MKKWQASLVAVVAFVAVCLYLKWIWDTYGQDYALTWVSIFIAVIVALVALISLKITRDSLKLTRSTTRPFLNYLVKDLKFNDENDEGILRIVVSNKGNLPAEKPVLYARQFSPSIEPGKSPMNIDEFIQELPNQDDLKKLLESNEKRTDTTYFPGETRNVVFGLEPNWVKEYRKSPYTAVAIVILYQSLQREFETIRWFLCDKSKLLEVQHKPIPERDHFK